MKKIFLILKILVGIIIISSVLAVDESNMFIFISFLWLFLSMVLFDSYSIKKYNHKIFYLIFLVLLIFQGLNLILGMNLIITMNYTFLLKIIMGAMLLGFTLIYIPHIYIFVNIIKDKNKIESFDIWKIYR